MATPTVTDIAPPIGSSAGGNSVTITGTNFTGATGVTIDGTAATGVTVVSDTSITCTTPVGSAGTASVEVTNGEGTNAANSLFIYVLAAPTDTYIYLKGGRGDGFVPLWTGYFADAPIDEQSEPYRNIFQSTAQTNATGLNGISSSGSFTIPGLMTTMNNITSPTPTAYDLQGAASYVVGQISDEAAGTPPQQFAKHVTWRGYLSSNGITYHYRLADILGVGSQPRSE